MLNIFPEVANRMEKSPTPGRGATSMNLRAAAVLTAAIFSAIPSTVAVAAPAAPAPGAPALKVLTTNTMLLPSVISDGWAQDERGGLISSAPYVSGNDVVVFQELFDNSASDILMNRLRGYPYKTPVIGRSRDGWDATRGAYSTLPYEDGGVAIASRWPITRKMQYIYNDSCGADAWAEKGFAYAQLNVAGKPVHVLGTHLQADDDGCDDGEGALTRTAQLKEMHGFVDSLKIPLNEPVIYTGDLNINRYGPEYPGLLRTLSAAAPGYAGHPYTSDPKTNPLTAERYPDAPREWLDYVLYDSRHARPTTWTNTGQAVYSPWWELDDTVYNRYSDHYPVLGS
ncbi:sphingomyelin phosphodiesterase [Streptomyces sp. RKAG290]|uniref:sphingomyelin phosphodiesterase n=1 Tax=Streptomyces sp. RKAG290 TaxID=2888348 RepID=UPI0027E308F9|nr:sphingomyelin phosphodiesterase [Streptomyces sp. RKAG290]